MTIQQIKQRYGIIGNCREINTAVEIAMQVAPTDVIGATMGSYNGQLQAYNAQQQAASANMGGLYGLGGSAIMGAGMFF